MAFYIYRSMCGSIFHRKNTFNNYYNFGNLETKLFGCFYRINNMTLWLAINRIRIFELHLKSVVTMLIIDAASLIKKGKEMENSRDCMSAWRHTIATIYGRVFRFVFRLRTKQLLLNAIQNKWFVQIVWLVLIRKKQFIVYLDVE